jgi:hypothetical protein
MHQESVLSGRHAQAIEDPEAEWAGFLTESADWVSQQVAAYGVLHSLSPIHIDSALRLFRIDSQFETAERDFARLCDRHDSVGVCAGRFLKYPLLRPQLPWPSDHEFDGLLKAGWTQSDIDGVRSMADLTRDLNHRLRAAAGRLICMPAFLAHRDAVQRLWESLPITNRPELPIAHSRVSLAVANRHLVNADQSLAEFTYRFGQFCDCWHLMGMASWELPNVQGPLWAAGLPPDALRTRGSVTVTTPWHFKVMRGDELGSFLEAEHRQQVAEHGIDDDESWQSYATLLEIFHWEIVLRSRYGSSQRKRGFFTQLETVLADMLSLSRDRVKVLRKRLRALRSGRLGSLRGLR